MRTLIALLLLSFALFSYAQNNENIVLDVNADNPSFVVELKANPTTGFQWSVVDYEKSFLALTKREYKKTSSNLIGSGGKMLFTFSLIKGKSYPRRTQILFKYSRFWEPKGGQLQKVLVNFMTIPKEGSDTIP